MKKLLIAALLGLTTVTTVVATTHPACAASSAADILAQVDKKIGNFTDQTIVFSVQNLKPGSSTPQPMRFKSYTKGGKNFIEFLEPGDMKGTRVLTMSATEIWIYLPEFGKIRRVASGNLEQGFLGTTLTQQDMGQTAYAAFYTPTLKSESTTSYVLDLRSKDAEATGYDHLVMEIDKAKMVPTKIEYVNAEGVVVRTQTRTNYQCPKPDYCNFGQMKMVDNTRAGAWTTLTPVEMHVDTGIADEIFSQRSLQLGL